MSQRLWFIAVAVIFAIVAIAVPLQALVPANGPTLLAGDATLGDQFRISYTGPNGDPAFRAFDAAAAYNSNDDQYLVVWAANRTEGEVEIYGQRLNAATEAAVGAEIRVSSSGPDDDADYTAQRPAVTYNSADNEYLVVWQGDDDTGSLVDDEFEIFAQRLNAATGALLGSRIRISNMGPDGDAAYDALNPDVVYNPADNEYLVVWQGDDDAGSLIDNENEIYGQRLSASGNPVGATIRISAMGPDGDADYRAQTPAVAHNDLNNEYLVVWSGDDHNPPLVAGELEIFGHRLDAATGALTGSRIRISTMGPDGDPAYTAVYPSIAYNVQNNHYLVAWSGDDDSDGLVDDELEIFAQRLNAANGALSGNRIRVSSMGPDGNPSFRALHPAVAYHGPLHQYLVVWRGEDNRDSLMAGEHEIFGQWLDAATGAELLLDDWRISQMGSADGDADYQADRPALAYRSSGENILVAWHGDDDRAGLVEDEFEIFARSFELDLPPSPTPTPTPTSTPSQSIYLPLVVK